MLSYWDVLETHMSFWIYVMLTLPLRLTSESFLGGQGGRTKLINTGKLLEILCQLQLFDVSKDLQTLVTFFERAKTIPACFTFAHAFMPGLLITWLRFMIAWTFRVASLTSPCLPGVLGQFISDHWSDPKRIGLTELQASDRTHTGGAKIFFQRYPQFSSTIFSPSLSS